MSRFEDFSIGDHVAHISLGDGVVTATDRESVYVAFARKQEKGRNLRGIYDRDWFRIHPNYLFQRSAKP